jgi:hypothetical protein
MSQDAMRRHMTGATEGNMPTHPRSTDNVVHLDAYRSATLAASDKLPAAWLITGPDCHLYLEDEGTTKLVVAALNNAWRAGLAAGKALRDA